MHKIDRISTNKIYIGNCIEKFESSFENNRCHAILYISMVFE